MEDILCSMCNYTTNSQKNLTYHTVRQHRNDSNFHVKFTFPHCFYSSRSCGAFKSHFSRQHRQRMDVGTISVPDDEHDNEISPICSSQNEIDMHCANFALNLMTKLKILASGVDHVIEETINLLKIAEEL